MDAFSLRFHVGFLGSLALYIQYSLFANEYYGIFIDAYTVLARLYAHLSKSRKVSVARHRGFALAVLRMNAAGKNEQPNPYHG